MSALTELRKIFRDQGLDKSAKAFKKDNLQVFTLDNAIKQFSLDIYTGMDPADLKDNPESVFKAFIENNLSNRDHQFVVIDYRAGVDNFSLSNLANNVTKCLLERDGLNYSGIKIKPYVDTDSYLADLFNQDKMECVALQADKDMIRFILFFAPLPLPTLQQFETLKRYQEMDNPDDKIKKAYQELYQDIKKRYKSNKNYLIERSEVERKRQLDDESSRNFLRLYNYLQTSF